MMRKNFLSGTVWEDIVGYSRAVKVGNIIEISGTTSVVNNEIIGKGDAYLQTKTILAKIKDVLEQAGATMNDVVRTRMYVTDISQWEKIARAHSEFFGQIKPASTMVEVQSLIDPNLLIEIEATAIVD